MNKQRIKKETIRQRDEIKRKKKGIIKARTFFHISLWILLMSYFVLYFRVYVFLIHVFLYLYSLLSQNPNFVAWVVFRNAATAASLPAPYREAQPAGRAREGAREGGPPTGAPSRALRGESLCAEANGGIS